MPRKSKVGGARPGAGRKPRGSGAIVRREVKLLESEAAAHDLARGERPWGDWIRAAAEREIARKEEAP